MHALAIASVPKPLVRLGIIGDHNGPNVYSDPMHLLT